MPLKVTKTRFFGKKNNSYLPVFAHTTTGDKTGRDSTVYRLGKRKTATQYVGKLYSEFKTKINKKKHTPKKKHTLKKRPFRRGGTLFDDAGIFRGTAGDKGGPITGSTVPSTFHQDMNTVYNGEANFQDVFLTDKASSVAGPDDVMRTSFGGDASTITALDTDSTIPYYSMVSGGPDTVTP